MPPAGEAPPPYSEEAVASAPPSEPNLAHMPEPEENRGADCGSHVGANPNSPPPANPNNGVVVT